MDNATQSAGTERDCSCHPRGWVGALLLFVSGDGHLYKHLAMLLKLKRMEVINFTL